MESARPDTGVFKAIFEQAPVGLVVLDERGRLLYANRAFAAMVGTDQERVLDRPLSSLVHESGASDLEHDLRRLLDGSSSSVQLELRYGTGGGAGGESGERGESGESGKSWLRMNASCLAELAEQERVIVGFLEDVTEKKADEAKLKNEKEDAEKATRIKSDFLANMSHEIRTPIHTIIGMTELLRETRLDAEQVEYASQVEFSAEVLLSLVNDVLDFSKIEAGKLALESIEFDLCRAVEDAVDLVALEAHKKNLEVLVDIKRDVPRRVVGDPVRVRQIIVNLFNNAMKFTDQGEIAVTVNRDGGDADVASVRVSVRDTGIGIPPDKKNRLFREFSQVDSSTTRKYGGTGLGLSICRNLVALMNGSIDVDSEVGVGSEFWFTVPLEICAEETHDAAEGETLAEVNHGLIVDDNAAVRAILGAYLQEWGIRCEDADGGETALTALRAAAAAGDPFDLCMIDLLMPKMDGWHLASEINSDAALHHTKLFLMSPAGKSGDEAKMKLLNWFAGYITKPVKRDDLYGVLVRSFGEVGELEPVEELGPEISGPESMVVGALSGTILVAEDHEVNQNLFRTILESLGFRVTLAANGREAVEYADDDVMLIFMDVQMPEMNGYEATGELRRRGVDTPIIAVTANAVKGEREKAMEAGMSDFLTKPFKKADVVPLIRTWLLDRAAERASAAENVTADVRGRDTGGVTGGPFAGDAAAGSDREPPAAAAEIFDFEDAVETFLGNRDTVVGLVATLTERMDGQLTKIREFLDAGDLTRVREEAHSIKGSSRNLSISRVGDAAEVLEHAARDGEAEAAADAAERLATAVAEFVDYSTKITSR